MIIWLNGAFGSGKSQTAAEMERRLDRAFIYDPENFGYWMRRNQPKELHLDDFQDEPLWRRTNREMLLQMERDFEGGIILVPMTLIKPAYYEEIIGTLRQEGADVRHVVLAAKKRTLRWRLYKRLEFGGQRWAVRKIDECLEGLSDELFENHIPTDKLSIPGVAEAVAQRCGIRLDKPREKNAWKQLGQQIRTQLRVMR